MDERVRDKGRPANILEITSEAHNSRHEFELDSDGNLLMCCEDTVGFETMMFRLLKEDVEHLRDWLNRHAGVVPSASEPRMTFEPVHASLILLCRDALIRGDVKEAYHWLYVLDSKQVSHDPFKPWADMERIAGDKYAPDSNVQSHVEPPEQITEGKHYYQTGPYRVPMSPSTPTSSTRRSDQPSTQWKFWREARLMELEPYYCYWVSHLTSEGLHDKADIATVLAILHQQRDDMQDDALRLHREKMEALFGPDGKPRSAIASRWIPCSERLPEKDQRVLYYFEHVGIHAGRFKGGTCHGDALFTSTTGGFLTGDVTHWQPLPSAPTDGRAPEKS